MAPRPRTQTVSTKVSEDDHAMFAQFAGDQKVGEWVRDILFKPVLSEFAWCRPPLPWSSRLGAVQRCRAPRFR
jgi:hypothetical protein